MRMRAFVPSFALCLVGAGAAQAAGEGQDWDGDYGAKAKRRSDFTLGFSGGLGFGRADGYPNEVEKIDDEAYRSNTEVGFDNGGAIWLGVAFNDYLSFGLGVGSLKISGNDRKASGGAFLFHVDAYPLFGVHENLRDLGIFANLGAGSVTITGGREDAVGGSMAYVESGVVYERWRLWRIAMGPSVSIIHMWSESANMTGALFGGRFAFYSGP